MSDNVLIENPLMRKTDNGLSDWRPAVRSVYVDRGALGSRILTVVEDGHPIVFDLPPDAADHLASLLSSKS